MRKIGHLSLLPLLLAASGAALALADPESRQPPDRAPSLMTSSEIRAFNEGLDSAHPFYIKCRKDPVVGSLVRKLRVCRTNEDWKRFAAVGNDSGREVLDEMSRAPVSGNSPGFDACPAGRC